MRGIVGANEGSPANLVDRRDGKAQLSALVVEASGDPVPCAELAHRHHVGWAGIRGGGRSGYGKRTSEAATAWGSGLTRAVYLLPQFTKAGS